MSDLDALLAGLVADPASALRWLVMADWLEDHGFPERAELVRVHRELLRTCTEPDAFPERPQLHARLMDLMRAGVQPCLPQRTLALPGGVELTVSFIPPGSFLMGSSESERRRRLDEVRHQTSVARGFWLGVTPVTQRQWRAVAGTEPAFFRGDELPVESVSWEEATAFCAGVREATGLCARLPAEVEWEWAARAGTTTPFYWGAELNGTQANCDGEDPYGTDTKGPSVEATTPVGRYAAVSPHPWGLADISGNVWEWCEDDFEYYPGSEAVDPDGPRRNLGRVFRGGGWNSVPSLCRAAYRGKFGYGLRHSFLGFRVAFTLD